MKIKGSIYQGGGAGFGMPVEGGRLINNRPDGVMGIEHLASQRKAVKRAEKVSAMTDAYVSAEINSKMMGL